MPEEALGFAPDLFEGLAGSRRRARFGGTARAQARCSLAGLVAIYASGASVAVPACLLGLSAERGSLDPPR